MGSFSLDVETAPAKERGQPEDKLESATSTGKGGEM